MAESVDSRNLWTYSVYMPRTPAAGRLRVIDAAVIGHVIDHPARGRAWSLRELAAVLGCSHATIGHLRSGERDTISGELGKRFSEAVGCELAVLFVPAVSTESVDSTEAVA